MKDRFTSKTNLTKIGHMQNQQQLKNKGISSAMQNSSTPFISGSNSIITPNPNKTSHNNFHSAYHPHRKIEKSSHKPILDSGLYFQGQESMLTKQNIENMQNVKKTLHKNEEIMSACESRIGLLNEPIQANDQRLPSRNVTELQQINRSEANQTDTRMHGSTNHIRNGTLSPRHQKTDYTVKDDHQMTGNDFMHPAKRKIEQFTQMQNVSIFNAKKQQERSSGKNMQTPQNMTKKIGSPWRKKSVVAGSKNQYAIGSAGVISKNTNHQILTQLESQPASILPGNLSA